MTDLLGESIGRTPGIQQQLQYAYRHLEARGVHVRRKHNNNKDPPLPPGDHCMFYIQGFILGIFVGGIRNSAIVC